MLASSAWIAAVTRPSDSAELAGRGPMAVEEGFGGVGVSGDTGDGPRNPAADALLDCCLDGLVFELGFGMPPTQHAADVVARVGGHRTVPVTVGC